MTERLLMGNEAFAHAALEAGVGVVAGYPGTPSSEVIETIAKLVASGNAKGVHVEWSTNEKAALELAAAAAMSGKRALFTCKQVGLNVASDALMSLNYVGVRGGLVLLVADDPGPISSQTEQDTRRFAAFAKVPVLDPANPEQGFDMMKAAFDLSERYSTPVIVRPTTRIDHASTFFDVADQTEAIAENAAFQRDPRLVIFPKRSYEAHLEISSRLPEIAREFSSFEELARFNPIEDIGGCDGDDSDDDASTNADTAGASPTVGIICGGDSAAYAMDAIEILHAEANSRAYEQKIKLPPVRFMQVGTPYPFPEDAALRFLDGLSDVLVLEELDFVIEESILRLLGSRHINANVHGKLTDEAPQAGEGSTDEYVLRIADFIGSYAGNDAIAPSSALSALAKSIVDPANLYQYEGELPGRPPMLCAGCPHRGSFYAVKRALKSLGIARDDAVFCGDIGCYTLGNAMPLDAVDTCLCMGAGITMAQGIATANPSKKAIAFVGDSTFFASGLTGVANAVYNEHDITLCVLDNSTTAMTGMQPHPGTGHTLMGSHHAPLPIEEALKALGISQNALEIADPLNLDESVAACERAIAHAGPSAVIFRSPCIWLKRPADAVCVDTQKCTGCKRCITEIGCPAISHDRQSRGSKSKDRGQAFIDAALCTGCMLCTQICPTGAISSDGASEASCHQAEATVGEAHQQSTSTKADDAS